MKWLRLIAFPFCVVLLLAAFGMRFYINQWNKIGIGTLIGSCIFFIISIILERKEIFNSFKKRSMRYGLGAFAAIVLIVAILTVINYMSYKHYKRFDLTESKRFSIASQTLKLLENLPRTVHIMTFFGVEQALEQRKFIDLMGEFLSHTTKIKIDNYDLNLNPLQAQKYNVIVPGTIVFESAKRTDKINKIDEEGIINAIHKVTKDIVKVVYLLEGHQEISIDDTTTQGLSIFKDSLVKENYDVRKLVLAARTEVPQDASVVIIAGSTTDLLEHEIEMLNKYLESGGRVLLFVDPSSSASLAKIANQWGIQIDDDLIVDPMQSYYVGDDTIPIIHTVYGSPVSATFILNCFFRSARSIARMENPPENIEMSRIAVSSETSWGEFDKNVAQYDAGKDKPGPVAVSISAIKKLSDNQKEARLLVYGDSDFIRNAWFNILGNGNLALNSVAWLAEEAQLISLKEKPAIEAQLPFEPTLLKNFLQFSQLVLPGIIVLIGIIIWIKRRKL